MARGDLHCMPCEKTFCRRRAFLLGAHNGAFAYLLVGRTSHAAAWRWRRASFTSSEELKERLDTALGIVRSWLPSGPPAAAATDTQQQQPPPARSVQGADSSRSGGHLVATLEAAIERVKGTGEAAALSALRGAIASAANSALRDAPERVIPLLRALRLF